jgi:hypothetical protein
LDGATTPTMTKCASRQCWRTKGIAWQLKKRSKEVNSLLIQTLEHSKYRFE